jgi:hypothetical protein
MNANKDFSNCDVPEEPQEGVLLNLSDVRRQQKYFISLYISESITIKILELLVGNLVQLQLVSLNSN